MTNWQAFNQYFDLPEVQAIVTINDELTVVTSETSYDDALMTRLIETEMRVLDELGEFVLIHYTPQVLLSKATLGDQEAMGEL